MSFRTVRFCHLEADPGLKKGDVLNRFQKLGRMGSTGSSTGAHLHIGCVYGVHPEIWRLSDMGLGGKVLPDFKQLTYFVDRELFDTKILYTTYPYDPRYGKRDGDGNFVWVSHPCIDCVPEDRHVLPGKHFDIYWNRSVDGTVLSCGFDNGYGWYVNITFEVNDD